MMKKATIGLLLAIFVTFSLPILREASFFKSTVLGYFAFIKKEYASAFTIFDSQKTALIPGAQAYISLGKSAAWIELGNTDTAIISLRELSFSGNDRYEAERWYNLGNAYVWDSTKAKNGEQAKISLKSALAAYATSLSIRFDSDTDHNYREVLKRLSEYSPEENQAPEENSKSPEDTGDTKKETGSGTLESTGGSMPKIDSDELSENIENLRELQKQRGEYIRPDGKAGETPGNQGIPDSFRNFFGNDPFFEPFFGQERDGAKKNW